VFKAGRACVKAYPRPLAGFPDAITKAIDFVAKNPAKGQALAGKFLNLSPEVLATMRRPSMRLELTNKQITDWIDIMKRQSMIKSKTAPTDFLLD
jgi:ABC-type nitrate/sulfonate/bicarbonate transport system substrate-binding protein